jgi:glycosyltransferase involved in cell wall biosynthesis
MPSPTDISLVIPVYNGAGVLPRALASVFAQTTAPAEIIVVDDGSTDGTAEVALGFGDRVRVVQQPNAGVSAARNRGVAECRFELLALLDADDEWMPGFLKTIQRLVLSHQDCGMYCTSCSRRFANGSEEPYLIRGLPTTAPNWTGIIPDYFRIAGMSDPPVHSSAVVIRQELLNAIGGFPVGVTIGEDLLTWARMAARWPVAYDAASLVRFWQPAGAEPGVVARPTRMPQTPDEVGRALRDLLPVVPTSQRRSLRAYIALWHKMRASCYARLGSPGPAIRELGRAILVARFSATFYLGILRSTLKLLNSHHTE